MSKRNLRTITFDGICSDKIHLYVRECDLSPPQKISRKVTVPYKNGAYDPDKMIGYATYDNRTLTYLFDVVADSSTELESIKTTVENWLMKPVESKLYDSALPSHHFVGKCIGISEDDSDEVYSQLTVTFEVYPFKISEHLISEQPWDTFCFMTDTLASGDIALTASTNKTVQVWNTSVTPVELYIWTNGQYVTITLNNTSVTIMGEGICTGIYINPGVNNVVFNAAIDVNIHIDWIKEEL